APGRCCSKYTSVETGRPHGQLLECIVADQVNEAEWHIGRRTERRSNCSGAAFAWPCSYSASSNQSAKSTAVCVEVIRVETIMVSLALPRGISDVVAPSTATARWQDKSRSLRLGRAAEECRQIKHLARGATAYDSLPSRTTPCNFTTTRTSPTPAP